MSIRPAWVHSAGLHPPPNDNSFGLSGQPGKFCQRYDSSSWGIPQSVQRHSLVKVPASGICNICLETHFDETLGAGGAKAALGPLLSLFRQGVPATCRSAALPHRPRRLVLLWRRKWRMISAQSTQIICVIAMFCLTFSCFERRNETGTLSNFYNQTGALSVLFAVHQKLPNVRPDI